MTEIEIELSEAQFDALVTAVIVGADGPIEHSVLVETVERLEGRVLKAMIDGSFARLIFDGRIAVRWDADIDDWRVWVIEDGERVE